MKIWSAIKKYFSIWWIPLVAFILPFLLFFLAGIIERNWAIDIALCVLFANILGTIISSIVQLFMKKWYWVIPQLGVAGFIFYYAAVIFTFAPPDYYGKGKEIPVGIEFNEPLKTAPTMFNKEDFILLHGAQPGMYRYQAYFTPPTKGDYYIKAYEYTSNDRLSGNRMRRKSTVKALTHVSIHKGSFSIYEGSWGDKYGARIELWFSPDDASPEYKVAEKNYIVEGWMR